MKPVKNRAFAAITLLAALSIAAAGCGTTPETSAERSAAPSASAGSSPPPSPAPSGTRVPVAAAGGVCKLLSYQAVAKATGMEFDTAVSGGKGTSCALQVYGHVYPDLVLSSAATKVDAEKFHEAAAPDGASKLSGLGKAAYQAVLKPVDGSGPRVEVGWLAGGKIYMLRYSFEQGASEGQAKQMAGRLVALAKQVKTG